MCHFYTLPTGPAGPYEIGVAYLVTFNNNTSDGYVVPSSARLPISRVAMDNTQLCTIDPNMYTIQFSKGGMYRIDFTVYGYIKSDTNFDPNTDLISIGFRKIIDQTIYAGGSSWYTNEKNKIIFGQGMFIVNNPNEIFELVNLSKQTLYLNTPELSLTDSISYFSNPVVNILIQYLG